MTAVSDSQPEPAPEATAIPRSQRDVHERDDALTSSLVDALVQSRRSQGEWDAFEITTLAAAAAVVAEQVSRENSRSSDAQLPERVMVAELATASRSSERTVRRQMADAADLCARFAATVVALREGRVFRGHVRVIHDAGYEIDDVEARAAYERVALARAESMTPARLRPIAQVLAARANPRTVDERHAAARTQRGVVVIDLADAMARLEITMPATLAHGIHDRLTQQAHAVIDARTAQADPAPDATGTASSTITASSTTTASTATASSPTIDSSAAAASSGSLRGDAETDSRSMSELRADICADLLLTGTPESCVAGDALSAIRATVQITVPVLTAAGQGTEPAVLAGHGPIDADTARRLAGGARGWERVMTCPNTGVVLAVDRYRPGKDLKRFLRARDERCRFPGCRMPVWRCDLDHTIDAALGGPTSHANLAHLCRGHHTVKHASRWRVRQTAGGVLEWTSPTGRNYIDRPEPTLRFIPEAEPVLTTGWRSAAPDDPIWSFAPDGDPPPF